MPGFSVPGPNGPVGEGPSVGNFPYFVYTWRILSVFEELIDIGNPLVYAKDATLPTFTAGVEEVESASLVYKYAKAPKWEDVRLTWYDIPVNGISACDLIKNWRRRVWTPEGGVGEAVTVPAPRPSAPDSAVPRPRYSRNDGYKRDSRIAQFTAEDEPEEVRVWTLYGSWPQQIREGDLTYTDSEVKIVEVVLAYDWAECEEEGSSVVRYSSPAA
jgi:hypothetical protein